MTYPEPVAWKVEVNGVAGLVFATTEPKARWRAVKSYRNAIGPRRGDWPSVSATRLPSHDASYLRTRTGTLCFLLDP